MSQVNYVAAIGQLRELVAKMKSSGQMAEVAMSQQIVLARFQPIFNPAHIPELTADEFVSFLYIENNQHWHTLYRQRSRLTSDMDLLQESMALLLDESQPIGSRLDEVINRTHGLGKAVATAILLVAYPTQYGVWNNVSEGSMREMDLWPEFPWGTAFGAKYEAVNDLLQRIAADLDVDLWTLDLLWYLVGQDEDDLPLLPADNDPVSPAPIATPLGGQRFGLERHLQDFLWANWDQTELGMEWTLYGETGDDNPGYEYPTAVGRIDLLAKHRQEGRWLVVELKRGQTSDETVGQILRYMGWVQRHLAADGETVEGLIIARSPDEKLLYALEMQPQVALKLYEVEFRLQAAPGPGEAA